MERLTRSCRKCERAIALTDLNKVGNRWYCKDESGCRWKKKSKRGQQQVQRYVITAAQNNTVVHEKFFTSLQSYCTYNDAHLIVIPYRYRNPTSPTEASSQDDDEWYSTSVLEYLEDRRFGFKFVDVLADIKINPTAVNPLSGLESLSNGKSAIVAHPQIALKCIPTPIEQLPLILTTTGAVTVQNYSDSKAGKKGEFHHSFGAVVLERARDEFYIRNLSATSEGSFVDLGVEYNGDKRRFAATEALVMGDLHIGQTSPNVAYGTSKLINQLQPSVIALHDSFDGESVNHHEKNNPFAKFSYTFEDLEAELSTNARILKHYQGLCDELVIVNSNHNDFLYRWLQSSDWKYAKPSTAQFYLKAALQVTNDCNADIYGKEMRSRGVNACFLQLDESYKVKDIELGYHGHKGSNGSRGSAKQYARIGSKTIIGHSHTPCIEKGCFQVGTSTHLSLGYTSGMSSWLNTHCAVYDNGKRQLIHLIDGKYRL